MSEACSSGSCLCGEVRYEISPPYLHFQYCHCSRCRKATGSAHASNIILPPAQFRWLAGEDQVGHFIPEDTRHFANGFCRRCGSTLPWLAKTGKAMVVPAGTLDNGPDMSPEWNLFWESRATWYRLPHELNAYPTLPGKSEPCRLNEG
ncbi:GFA family protein [Neptuniibacter halophilus]|uniref:GFA family protein n=1 Tax=Neptuniibacter halophilus TaxID=651666 RepID=UPI002572E609|nr:GFA family protein [Neptuniibacter halophilus]